MDPHPRHTGHELHRLYTCPVLAEYREKNAPAWLLREVRSKLNDQFTLDTNHLAFYTRALARHPRPKLRQFEPDDDGHLEWVIRPEDGVLSGEVFVDGSRLYAEHDLFGLVTSIGFAFAAFDEQHNLTALARGRPPSWIQGIYGAELYGLMQAAVAAFAVTAYRTDCQAVLLGCRNGQGWANAPCRRFARAWGPLSTALDHADELVTWMPAHCTTALTPEAEKARRLKTLSDGTPLTRHLVLSNQLVDKHAKIAAAERRPPKADTDLIRSLSSRVVEVAMWIGMATEQANHWPAPPSEGDGARSRFVRDSEAVPSQRRPAPRKERQQPQANPPAPDFAAGNSKLAEPGGIACILVAAGRNAKACRAASRASADGDALRLQDWIEARPQLNPPQISAEERRLATLKRLRAKRRSCGCPVLGPECSHAAR